MRSYHDTCSVLCYCQTIDLIRRKLNAHAKERGWTGMTSCAARSRLPGTATRPRGLGLRSKLWNIKFQFCKHRSPNVLQYNSLFMLERFRYAEIASSDGSPVNLKADHPDVNSAEWGPRHYGSFISFELAGRSLSDFLALFCFYHMLELTIFFSRVQWVWTGKLEK